MRIFGVAGHSGMGKTTLLERLVPELSSRGKTFKFSLGPHGNHFEGPSAGFSTA